MTHFDMILYQHKKAVVAAQEIFLTVFLKYYTYFDFSPQDSMTIDIPICNRKVM